MERAGTGPSALDPQPPGAAALPEHGPDARWFFDQLTRMGPLRIISQSGASTFEALCRFGPHGYAQGFMNAMTDAYHWHLDLRGFGHLRSRDEVHARSGRRVLFFELRRSAGDPPFLRIYLHRAKGAAFDPALEQAFLAVHERCQEGVALARPEGAEG